MYLLGFPEREKITMYIIKVFAVWTPEAILNLIIVLLIAGMKDRLKLNKVENLIRFASTVTCMVLSSVFVWPLIDNYFNNISIVVSFLAHMFIYTLIIFTIYRISINKVFISVLLMGFTVTTFENSFFPFLVGYISGGYENYSNNLSQYIVFSCITRIAQVLFIRFLWNNQYIFMVTEINKKVYKAFSFFIFGLTICEVYISFNFSQYFGQMSTKSQIFYGLALIVMLILFYMLIFKIIYSVIRLMLTNGYKQLRTFELGAEEAFKSVYILLENNDIDSAKSYISLLIGSEENK